MGLAVILLLAVAVAAAFAAYIRLSPNDPARWHIDIASDASAAPGPCVDHITASLGSARVVCLVPDAAAAVLAKLAAIAAAAPRTLILAGDPASGRITWITRSALWGFPDFTTAQVTRTPDGTRLEIFSRLRFGTSDLGVNAARLALWLAAL